MAADAGIAKLATVAVSDCLLGQPVRWDGEDNGDGWPRATLTSLFELVGLCPEVGIGMGVPRAPIQLVGEAPNLRAVAVADPSLDYTARLAGYACEVAATLGAVSGYIFADRSPSCGLAGVKVFDRRGRFRRTGKGVYAAAVLAADPGLPAVDAETLHREEVLIDFAIAVVVRARGQDTATTGDCDIRAEIGRRLAA